MQPDGDDSDPSRKLALIAIAYLGAFLPWTILTAKDFSGTEWKTVRETLRYGLFNLLSLVPAPAILIYIIQQDKAQEYTEMFAATSALFFVTLHLLRTL